MAFVCKTALLGVEDEQTMKTIFPTTEPNILNFNNVEMKNEMKTRVSLSQKRLRWRCRL